MSGPYRAVITDSFRAALASRVLWIAFVAIWILLGALAPIGYREEFTTTFRWQDFENGTRMKAMLAQGLVDPAKAGTPLGRLAAAMPEPLRRQLHRVGQGDEVRIDLRDLADALNEQLDDEDWYDPQAWQSTVRLRELRQLNALDEDQLSESLRRRRARLRIEAALPGVFEARSARSITLTYAGVDFPARFAIDKTRFVSLINQWVVPTLINWLLGFVLVFLGILVTASIVPDMLQPGSLHLLLSKPISRSLLLLSKFVGGCAFVLLCVTQLVIGLWLIAGWRLDVWNARLLWCIPVFVFLFAVYYSISVVAGLKWRSPVLAIGVTCMFGAFFLIVGMVGSLFDQMVTRPDRIKDVVLVSAPPASGSAVDGATLIASTQGGGLMRLDTERNRWVEIFESNAMNRDLVLPPVRLDRDSVATARIRGGRFNPYGSGSLDLLLLSQRNGWSPQTTLRLPVATTDLAMAGSDRLLARSTGGLVVTRRQTILDAAGETSSESVTARDESTSGRNRRETQPASAPATGSEDDTSAQQGWLSNLLSMQGRPTSQFQSILPDSVALVPPAEMAVAADGQSMVLVTHGRIVRLQRPSGNEGSPWELTADRTLPGEPSLAVVVAVEGRHVLVARGDQPVLLLDAVTLETVARIEPLDSGPLTEAVGLGDGKRFAVLTGEGRVRIVRAPTGNRSARLLEVDVPVSEVETLALHEPSGTLIVAHDVDRIDLLRARDLRIQKKIRPSLQRWRLIDRYVITPLRTLTPQTGELGETVAAIVSGQSTVALDPSATDQDNVVRYHIARPVLGCAAFMVVMLTIGCVHFARRDF